MGFDSIWHWLVLLIVVLLIFGTKKLRNIGSDLGGAVRDFKKGVNGDEAAKPVDPNERLQADEVDAQAQKQSQSQRETDQK